ncbi:hypothetical protein EAX61_02645 [Dokdonia sinensis]|uniref:UBP-type domain-containing protein n=1 Tax=Dokdonia sinensis TaxID=2479847 RepID=A0A3M0GQ59_9FLAO|nr:UBP-type zinc finger domain-containing protein [Dokdonia sinensis]RMB63309.1 hypothetical protein EAX61_02645 [Dokdonia sinensis]
MAFRPKTCQHLIAIKTISKGDSYECAECAKTGDSWLHLRTCQECGTTLCCDSSPNKHASKHAINHNHPVTASAEPGERWMWCYKDKEILKY